MLSLGAKVGLPPSRPPSFPPSPFLRSLPSFPFPSLRPLPSLPPSFPPSLFFLCFFLFLFISLAIPVSLSLFWLSLYFCPFVCFWGLSQPPATGPRLVATDVILLRCRCHVCHRKSQEEAGATVSVKLAKILPSEKRILCVTVVWKTLVHLTSIFYVTAQAFQRVFCRWRSREAWREGAREGDPTLGALPRGGPAAAPRAPAAAPRGASRAPRSRGAHVAHLRVFLCFYLFSYFSTFLFRPIWP